MDDKVIPDTVAQFLLEKIESIAELEGLLILHRNPQKKWGARDLADRLYIREPEAAELLRALSDKGLAVLQADEFSYHPATTDLGKAIDLLAEIYSRHIVPVTNLIHSKPKHKVQGFADAFKFRKEE